MAAVRNRGIVRLDEEILCRALNLPKGQRVIGFRDNPATLSIDVCVEGDGLPEVHPGAEAPIVNAHEYATWPAFLWALRGRELAEMVEVIAGRLDDSADGDAGSYAQDLRRILAGDYDPRPEKKA